MQIIDAHVYCIPEMDLNHVRWSSSAGMKRIFKAIYCNADGMAVSQLARPDKILDSMKQSGINKSVLVSFPWPDPYLCDLNNAYILNTVKKDNNFLAICSVTPNDEYAIKKVEDLVESGAIGIKINPNWQNFRFSNRVFHDVLNLIEKKNLFLLLHVDQSYKHQTASANFLVKCAESHPNLKILAAHMGGLVGAYELIPSIKNKLKNVWYDTAISATPEFIKFYCDIGLHDKVIFGTDFPFNHSHSQEQLLNDLLLMGIDQNKIKNILSVNFEKMLLQKN